MTSCDEEKNDNEKPSIKTNSGRSRKTNPSITGETSHSANSGLGYAVDKISLDKLKNSTKRLLNLINKIQSRTHDNKHCYLEDKYKIRGPLEPIPSYNKTSLFTESFGQDALKKLELQENALESIYKEEKENDCCTVYKRLTRRCHCLNRDEFNDLMIHFNEGTKSTTNLGEIIKNMKIAKKFLYIGGDYTKNTLLFLNEALLKSTRNEKAEIIDGISHADICNVFEDDSIVKYLIYGPEKYEYYNNDFETQGRTASFIYKIAQNEEGKHYLNYNLKITNDIKKVLRKHKTKIDNDTADILQFTLNLMYPTLKQHLTVAYSSYSNHNDEGVASKIVEALSGLRECMTMDHIIIHMQMLLKISEKKSGKTELKSMLPEMLSLFKEILLDYDNTEINAKITQILNNIVSSDVQNDLDKDPVSKVPTKLTMTADIEVETQPVKLRNTGNQVPERNYYKKLNKSKTSK